MDCGCGSVDSWDVRATDWMGRKSKTFEPGKDGREGEKRTSPLGIVIAPLRIKIFPEVGHVVWREWFSAVRGFGNLGGWGFVFLLLRR